MEASNKNEKVVELPKQEEMSIDRLQKELDRERQRANDYFKQLQYLQADFENYRKRVEKEIAEAKQTINESFVKSLLSVVDELELAIKAVKESGNKETILKGLEMVLKNLYSLLEGQGLVKIEALGSKFDPNKHESAEVVMSGNYEEGTIIEEIRKGFTFKGKVIRPSLVKVAVKPLTN
ncbi:MAG: nucleotide exchange factor GrpE [Nitrososphaerales archaeon]|nr:nucleotide exchange factor GrpE [Nitrososphaerales archaeon]